MLLFEAEQNPFAQQLVPEKGIKCLAKGMTYKQFKTSNIVIHSSEVTCLCVNHFVKLV